MTLSKRLETIISFVDKGECVADIGSDHGFVSIELIKRNIAEKVFAVENKEGPFSVLKKNTEQYKNIVISFSDGIEALNDEFKTVIIAGMGFHTIKRIIEKSKEKIQVIDTFIIDSHTLTEELRKYFVTLGYYISNESCLLEKDVFYEIIKFKKGSKNYSKLEYKYGPILLKNRNRDFIMHYRILIEKYKNVIENNKLNSLKYNEFNEKIRELEELIDEN